MIRELSESSVPAWWQTFIQDETLSNRPRRGDIIKARILSMSSSDIFVDLQGKRDGIIQQRDLDMVDEDYLDALNLGDDVPVRVLGSFEHRNAILVSLKQGLAEQDWLRAQDLLENETVVEVEVLETNRGGVIGLFGQVRGFIPNSHLTCLHRGMDAEKRDAQKADLVGSTLSVVVIEVASRRRRLILSQRMAQKQLREGLLDQLYEGAIVTGKVRNLTDFGAFVDLGGIDGLVHISELSYDFLEHPREAVQVGDEIDVYVLKVERERMRISLSRKLVTANPYELAKAGAEVAEKVTE